MQPSIYQKPGAERHRIRIERKAKCRYCRDTGIATEEDFDGRIFPAPCSCPNGEPLEVLEDAAFLSLANDAWNRICADMEVT